MTAVTVNSPRSAMSRVGVLAACLLAGTLGVAHAAAPAADIPSVVVSYGDLDLSSTDGVRTLYKRISLAAQEVCPSVNSMEAKQVAFARHCRKDAIEHAVAQIHSAQLVALSTEHAKRG
jgi:UrcA family protein